MHHSLIKGTTDTHSREMELGLRAQAAESEKRCSELRDWQARAREREDDIEAQIDRATCGWAPLGPLPKHLPTPPPPLPKWRLRANALSRFSCLRLFTAVGGSRRCMIKREWLSEAFVSPCGVFMSVQ